MVCLVFILFLVIANMAACKDVITGILNCRKFVHVEVLVELFVCTVLMSELAALSVVAKLAFPEGAAVLSLENIMSF